MNKAFGGVDKVAEQAALAVKETGKAAESAGKAAQKGSKGINIFGNSIMRIVKYRIIRGVIRSITNAFSEGLQNVREYSETMSGEARRMAETLKSLSVANQTMKNQIGSAWGELISIVTPYIHQLISAITKLADWLSQLFAALGGHSYYYKAVDATSDIAKNTAAGAASAKELRRQLMGFDEINRLDAPDNGGGGGGGASANANNKMFEYSPIGLQIMERLKPAIDRVREAFARLGEAWQTLKENFDGSWLQFIIDDLLVLGGDLILDGLVVLIDMLTVLVELFNALQTGDWSGFEDAFGHLFEDIAKMVDDLRKNLLLVIIDALIPIAKAFDQAFGTDLESHLIQTRNNIMGLETPLETTKEQTDELKRAIQEQGIVTKNTTADITLSTEEATASISAMGSGFTDTMFILQNLHMPTFHIDGWSDREFSLGPFGSFTVSLPQIAFYRSGGYPNEDGLFLANHNELVGKFSNGRTAVANNEQIVEGIKRGVLEAMTAALSGNSGTQNVNVYLDGKQITNAVTKNQRQMSRATGVAYG